MSIYLGNITFGQVRETLGYELTKTDKELWDKFHNNTADLSGKNECFHIFDMPMCIKVKGSAAKKAIIDMFTPDKLVEPMGTFTVYEQK